jgi:hypothetical protein
MTAETLQAPRLAADRQKLIDALVQDLVANQTGRASRDLGPDVSGSAAGPDLGSQDDQRFFGSVLQSIITHVIPTVAPIIHGILQQRRRELGLPDERDADALQRDFGSILGALLPTLLQAIPGIVSAISGQRAPRGPEEESQRFLPFLAALIPAVVSAVPSIIGLFNRQRGVDDTPPPITDPAVAQRFLGPLLSTFIPQLLQAAPSILGSIFGGGRDVGTSSTW